MSVKYRATNPFDRDNRFRELAQSFRSRIGLGLSAAVALGTAACGDGNVTADLYYYGLEITVVDGAGEAPGAGGAGASDDGCAATITISDGDYSEEPLCKVEGDDCFCRGAGERVGTYLVEVSLGDSSVSEEVTVVKQEDNDAHVETQTLTIEFE